MTTPVQLLQKSRASPDVLPFSLCNKKRLSIWHINRPLFPTTLSNPSYDIGKQIGLRTCQHPHVIQDFDFTYQRLDNTENSTGFQKGDTAISLRWFLLVFFMFVAVRALKFTSEICLHFVECTQYRKIYSNNLGLLKVSHFCIVCHFYVKWTNFQKNYEVYCNQLGQAVAQLVEALRCKSEVRGFDYRWCHWRFSLT